MAVRNITCWTEGWGEGTVFYITDDQWNCAEHFLPCDCPTLTADPDIAGIGVLVALAFSATLAVVSGIGYLLLASTSKHHSSNNIFDRFWNDRLCEPVQLAVGEQYARIIRLICYDLVLCLGDQHLVTGISFLIGALIRIFSDGSPLSVYHFNMITDFFWLSSSTHLMSLQVLSCAKIREHAERPPGEDYTGERLVTRLPTLLRVCLMILMDILYLWALWTTAYVDWDIVVSCPVRCTLNQPRGGGNLGWAIFNTAVVLRAYITSLGRLYSVDAWTWLVTPAMWVWKNIARPILSRLPFNWSWPRKRRPRWLGTTLRIIWHFIVSRLEDLLETIAWHCVAYWALILDRSIGHETFRSQEQGQAVAAENSLGFGQLIPLLLLILSLVQILDSLAAHVPQKHQHAKPAHASTDLEEESLASKEDLAAWEQYDYISRPVRRAVTVPQYTPI